MFGTSETHAVVVLFASWFGKVFQEESQNYSFIAVIDCISENMIIVGRGRQF